MEGFASAGITYTHSFLNILATESLIQLLNSELLSLRSLQRYGLRVWSDAADAGKGYVGHVGDVTDLLLLEYKLIWYAEYAEYEVKRYLYIFIDHYA